MRSNRRSFTVWSSRSRNRVGEVCCWRSISWPVRPRRRRLTLGRLCKPRPAAEEWVEKLLHDLRHGQEARVVRRLEQLLESPAQRPAEVQKVVAGEVNYFKNHRDHLHYQAVAKAGAPIGSGAVESLGSQLQDRLRGCGRFWGRPGITHLLRFMVLLRNQDDCHLWN